MKRHAHRNVCLTMVALLAGCASPPSIEEAGGVRLVYEIDREAYGSDADDDLAGIDMEYLSERLEGRLVGSGYVGAQVTPLEDFQVQIDVPNVDQNQLGALKKIIAARNDFSFHIVANARDDAQLIERARQTEGTIVTDAEGEEIGRWVTARHKGYEYAAVSVGDVVRGITAEGATIALEAVYPTYGSDGSTSAAFDQIEFVSESEEDLGAQLEQVQLLLRLNPNHRHRITGEHIKSAYATLDQVGQPAVSFYMTDKGSALLSRITASNLPDMANNWYRRMAIVFNDEVVSAPRLLSTISDQGQITGDFTQREVDDMVAVLNAGRLPANLQPEPVSETWVEPGARE